MNYYDIIDNKLNRSNQIYTQMTLTTSKLHIISVLWHNNTQTRMDTFSYQRSLQVVFVLIYAWTINVHVYTLIVYLRG
jgi:hypothetical protein